MAINISLYPQNFFEIGTAFAASYYDSLQKSKESVVAFYHDHALMTYEGQPFQGRESIHQKFKSLTFQKLSIALTSTDSHPVENGVLIFVIGQLKSDDDVPIGFSETFLLRQNGQGYAIVNHIFRLTLHHFA